MKRKLIQQGGGGFTIYLPKDWIESHNLKKGEEVTVEDQGETLEIRPDSQTQNTARTQLEFKDELTNETMRKYVQRIIAAAYKRGVDVIEIQTPHETVLDYVEQRIESFIGMEIIEEKEDTLILKSLITEATMQVDQAIHRAILLTRHITDEICQAVTSRNEGAMKNLLRLERTHNKMTDYAKRQLAKKKPSQDARYTYAFIMENERLVDQYKYIIRHHLDTEQTLQHETEVLLKDVNSYVNTLLDMVESSQKGMKQITAYRTELHDEVTSLLQEEINPVTNTYIQSIVIRTYEMGEALVEGRIDF